MLTFNKRLNGYVNSTKTNWLSCDKENAVSYGWWVYLRRINGVLVFNNTTYSSTTCKHQLDVARKLDWNFLTIHHTTASLDNLSKVITDLKNKILSLQAVIANPRTKLSKNIERQNEIEKIQGWLKVLEG
jgi:hypothetical protein